MCLIREKLSRQKRFLARFKNNELICYKILRINENNKLYSAFHYKRYLPRWNVADGKPNVVGNIYAGAIHVYTSLKELKNICKNCTRLIIVPVHCKKYDFLGYGYGQACFKKVYLSQKDYNKAIIDGNRTKMEC